MNSYSVKRVLVPLDFSQLSFYALEHAEHIAKRTHAEMTLVHVGKPLGDAVGTSGMLASATQWEEREKTRGLRRLQKIAREVKKRSHLQADTLSVIGRISQTLISTAKDTDADLIVMGTHGANGFLENLLGSTAYHISGLSPVPVLTVHKPAGRRPFRHLVYPVRGSSPAMNKIDYALTLAKAFRAHVHIVELIKETDTQQSAAIRELAFTIEKEFAGHGLETTHATASAHLAIEALIRYASQHTGALVVILREPDFALVDMFRGTFSKRVLHSLLSPVLTIPPQQKAE